MPDFEVLYYPNFVPSKALLRSYLLFFDTVRTIVPKDAEFELSKSTLELLDEIPGSFEPFAPRDKDIRIDDLNRERLVKAFKQIKTSEKNITSDTVTANCYNDIKLNGLTLLHSGKVSYEILNYLREFHLIEEESRNFDLFRNNNYYSVNKEAADLIVSLVADNIAKSNGFNTITDQSLSFTMNSLNSLDYHALNDTQSLLSYSLINCIVPQDIGKLSTEDYIQIYDEYKIIHESFQEAVSDLNTMYRLGNIDDYGILENKINKITQKFNSEIEELKNSDRMSKIKNWGSIGIGGISAVASYFGNNSVPFAIAMGSLIIRIINWPGRNYNPEPRRAHIQRMIGHMKMDIAKKSHIEARI